MYGTDRFGRLGGAITAMSHSSLMNAVLLVKLTKIRRQA